MLEHSLNFVYFTVELGGHFRYEVQCLCLALSNYLEYLPLEVALGYSGVHH